MVRSHSLQDESLWRLSLEEYIQMLKRLLEREEIFQ